MGDFGKQMRGQEGPNEEVQAYWLLVALRVAAVILPCQNSARQRVHIWVSLPFPPTLICSSLKGQLDWVQVSQEPILCSPFFPLQQLADCSGLKGFMVTLLIHAQNNPSKGKLIAPLPEAAGNLSVQSAFCYLFYTWANNVSPKIPAGKQLSAVCCISLQEGSSVCDWTFHHHLPSSNCP